MKRFVLALGAGLCFGAIAADTHDHDHALPGTVYTYETVAAYAESWDFAIRWGAGTIKVVDETGILKREPKILETLNMNLGTTKMVLVDGVKGDITIKMVDDLPAPYGQNGCGLSQSKLGLDGAQVVENIIRIKSNNRCMGENEGAALLLHELGHALGFAKHAKEDDVMSTHDPAFELNKINLTTLQHFLKGLYSLDVGAKIPGKQRMPDPAPASLAYYAPVKEKGPVLAVVPTPEERLPEVTFAAPTQQYRKVEKRDAQGRISWEFVQIGGPTDAPGLAKTSASGPAGKKGRPASRFETIQPQSNVPAAPIPGAYTPVPTSAPVSAAEAAAMEDANKGYISFGPRR